MRVAGILEAKGRDVETVSPDSDLQLVMHRMAARRIGALVVTTGSRVEGTISERDIVRALAKHGGRVLDLRVREVMSRNGPTCSPDDTLQHVMGEMTRTRHRHLPVVDGSGDLCGLVSIGDVVKHRLSEMELETRVLRDAYLAHGA
jgi:CBS domain-containing protein